MAADVTRRDALMWAARLYATEADAIYAELSERPGERRAVERAEHLSRLADRVYADAVAGLDAEAEREAWRRAMALFAGG